MIRRGCGSRTPSRSCQEDDFSKADFNKVLKNPAKLGLPTTPGNPEGYLFPATYDFGPDATPSRC